MKRAHQDHFANQEPIQSKIKTDEPAQIFSIAQIERSNTEGSLGENKKKDIVADKQRVCVSSKVNFSKLNAQEQYARFQNQAKKIKKLRNKLKTYADGNIQEDDIEIRKALKKVKESKHELLDQKDIIENLIKAITEGKLVPNTLPYNQICTILRDSLGISYTNWNYAIKVPEGIIPISELEYSEYVRQPCIPSVLQSFTGNASQEQDRYADLLRAVQIQLLASFSDVGAKNLPGLLHQ